MAERTPLHIALDEESGVDIIESMLAADADVNVTNKNGETALYNAIRNNCDLGVIKALLAAGADVHYKDYAGNTLLHLVKSADVAKELISLGLSVNVGNIDGVTPLHIAAKEGNGIELIESLLAAGADVNVTDFNSETVLYQAVYYNSDLRVIQALLAAGGEVKCSSYFGNSLLQVVYSTHLVGIMLDHFHYPNLKVKKEWKTSLINEARRESRVELIESLLAAGDDVNGTNRYGETVLYCAVINNCDFRELKALLAAGADFHCSVNGNSLLHVLHSAEVARELISLGLNVNGVNREGEMPLHIAIKEERGINVIEYLLSAGADVNAKNNGGNTCLYHAVINNSHLRVIRLLLMAGGDVHYKDNGGNTLLHHIRNADVAREVLSHGLHVNETNIEGKTPLYCVTVTMYKYISKKCKHELYIFNDRFLQPLLNNECYICWCKELVWTLVLNGAKLGCNAHSLLIRALMGKNMLWTKFFIKTALIKSYFDGLEGIIDINSCKGCLYVLKTGSIRSNSVYIELCQFIDSAVAEIVYMKSDMISHNHSLYKFFSKCWKSKNIFPLCPSYDNVEKSIFEKYPIYRELVLPNIRTSIERSTILTKLKCLTIYVKTSETKEISLEHYIFLVIADFLSNDDLANLTKCAIEE